MEILAAQTHLTSTHGTVTGVFAETTWPPSDINIVLTLFRIIKVQELTLRCISSYFVLGLTDQTPEHDKTTMSGCDQV